MRRQTKFYEAENDKGTPGPGATTEAPAVDEGLNSKAKELPWVKALIADVSALRKDKEAREKAEADAKAEAERREAEAKGDYEKLKATYDNQVKELNAKALAADIKAALLQQGAKVTNGLVKATLLEYQGLENAGDVSAFVEGLKSNDDYKIFFEQQTTPVKPAPPMGGTANSGGAGQMTDALALEYEHSPDLEKKRLAWAYFDKCVAEGRPLPQRK